VVAVSAAFAPYVHHHNSMIDAAAGALGLTGRGRSCSIIDVVASISTEATGSWIEHDLVAGLRWARGGGSAGGAFDDRARMADWWGE
ncbi:hypothetical protein AB0B48_15495, partial [Micromonospora sp. NPDC049089]|uniref:hypothetical protein n=1 Tax=Micromonospora sp. NPDC049089 TaxID=3155496 RepID=UPI0033FC8550